MSHLDRRSHLARHVILWGASIAVLAGMVAVPWQQPSGSTADAAPVRAGSDADPNDEVTTTFAPTSTSSTTTVETCTTNDPDNVPSGADASKEWWEWGPQFDTDRDGLPNKWEDGSVFVDGTELKLHQQYGTSSTRKDLFVRIDHEQGQQLSSRVTDRVIRAFDESPLDIAVHILPGGSIPDATIGRWVGNDPAAYRRLMDLTGFSSDLFAGGCGVPQIAKYFVNIEGCEDGGDGVEMCGFYEADGSRPKKKDKETQLLEERQPSGRTPHGGSVGSVGADISWVTILKQFSIPDFAEASDFVRASNLVHELGHSLGLRHHGSVDDPDDSKEYLSVMSYAYSAFGIPRGSFDSGLGRIDYSRTAVVNLDWELANPAKQRGKITFIAPGQEIPAANGSSEADVERGAAADADDADDEWSIQEQMDAADPSSITAFIEELGLVGTAQAPEASSSQMAVRGGTSTPVAFVATDPDGDALRFRVYDGPQHGTLTFTDGALSYAPDAGFVGGDELTFRAFDGYFSSVERTVSIAVAGVADPDRSYVAALFEDFLDRAPTAAELDDAAAALAAGTLSRRKLADRLAHSEEWISVIVDRMYQDTLGRAGDPGGVAYWTKQLQTGRRSVAEVAAAFYASPEYFRKLGGGTASTWVADLYPKLLGRPADPSGLSYWVGKVASRGRSWVALAFYQSEESRRARVTGLYDDLLHRTPDASGLSFWANRVRTQGDLALAIQLATSNEYANRAVVRFPTA